MNTEKSSVTDLVITPMKMLELAIANNAGMEQLERLMAMQERYEANEARKAFNEALAKFKSESLVVGKNGKVEYKDRNNNVTSYRHATLANVCNTIGPALAAYGLSVRWHTEQCEGGKIKVTCILSHIQGHSESVSLESQPDASGGKNSIQAVGSTVSYLQRYTVLAVTGTATEEQDDDGVGASTKQTAKDIAEAAREPHATDATARQNLIADLEIVASEQGLDAYAEAWKKLEPAQRKSIGTDEHERLKKIATSIPMEVTNG